MARIRHDEKDDVRGNLWIKTSEEDFSDGMLDGTVITGVYDGEITLDKDNGVYKPEGMYTSNVIHTAPFEYMVLSWDADTPEGTSIKIEAQALVGKGEEKLWSRWLSWGTWSTDMERTSEKSGERDELACVDTDTLRVLGSKGETAAAVRYRLTLNTDNPGEAPVVRLVAGTLRNTIPGQEIPSLYPEDENILELSNLNKEIDVPCFSQYLREPNIAHSICSPTSITMILGYHGVRLLPEETAWGVYDNAYEGFGNWPFSAAYAASHGFTTYIRYCQSVNDLKREIYFGYPAAVSVKYKNSEEVDAKFPVIHGAPIARTAGHIIVVCGFTHENGKEYVIVNDPAAASDDKVRLKYLVEEFDAAWQRSGRVAYIIHEGSGGNAAPKRKASLLREVSRTSDSSEFELISEDELVDLTSDRVKTIMVSKDGGRYEYATPGEGKNFILDKPLGAGRYDFIFILKGNKVYFAEISF